MQHLLDRNVSRRFRAESSNNRMGITMLLDHGEPGDHEVPAYIEGLGAVFSVSVDIPLIGPQFESVKPESHPPVADSEWERARAELSGPAAGNEGSFRYPGSGGGTGMSGQPAPSFDASKVDQLKRTLVRALRNGVNLRGVQPDEWIVVVVTGAPDSDSLTMMQQSAIAALKKDPLTGWPGAVPTTWWGAGRSTVMTIRVKKSDAGSIPDADVEPSATGTGVKSLSVSTYYGGRVSAYGGRVSARAGGAMMPTLDPSVPPAAAK